MAHCVISAVVDSDTEPMSTAPACMVHTAWAPCLHDGEPACTTPLHSPPGTSRSDALRMWKIRTHSQRPLVIHRVDGRSIHEHALDEGTDCACGPEVHEAVAA
jgi:hypothetical protein